MEDDPEHDRLGPFWEDVKQTVDRLVEHEQLLRAAGDPDKLAPMTPHFFGAVIIDQPEKVDGGVVTHEVIDGQQRRTTAQLLITAAARTCEAAAHPKHASRLRKLWMQDEDVDVAGDERFKLRPTRYDRTAFATVMDPQAATADGRDKVSAAYRHFAEQLETWVTELPAGQEDEYFDGLRDTIYEHLLFVVIELQPGDNPQGIFESLNAQGERLLAIDLTKNHVFRRARRAELDLERLDTEVWSARSATSGGARWSSRAATSARAQSCFLCTGSPSAPRRRSQRPACSSEFSRLFGADRVDLSQVEAFSTPSLPTPPPDEYVAASTKALAADQVTEFERQVRSMYDQMHVSPSSRYGRGSSTSVPAACRPS